MASLLENELLFELFYKRATNKMSLKKDDLESALQSDITNGRFPIVIVTPFHFHWEDDNTRAECDFKSLKSMMDILGYPKSHELVIESHEAQPGWCLAQGLDTKVALS